MSHLVNIINGKTPSGGNGGVSDADLSNVAVNFLNPGVVTSTDYQVTEQGTPNMTVKVNTGKAYVPNGSASMMYVTSLDATVNATIGSNASGNPRIDAIAIKLDLGATPDLNASNVASIVVVAGTPGASPSAPNDAAIQAAVGSGNPFYRLANVTVANGAASITNANIASTRSTVTLKDNVATKKSSAHIYRTTTQAISNGSLTVVTFDAETWDTDAFHDNSTNPSRFTIPSGGDGKYHLNAQIALQASGTNARYIEVKKNGSTRVAYVPKVADGTFETVLTANCDVDVVAGDYIEFFVYQNSGGSLNVQSGDGTTFVEIRRVG